MRIDIVTFGAALCDAFLFVGKEDAMVMNNPKKDMTRKKLVAFEYGAKINATNSVRSFGGGALNAAVTFARMGFKTAAAVSTGDDDDADAIERHARKEGISTEFMSRDKKKNTGLSVLAVAGSLHDHVAIIDRGANESYNFVLPSGMAQASWFYTTSLSGGHWKKAVDAMSRVAHDNAIKWAWNPGSLQLSLGLSKLGSYLERCTVLILNRDEAIGLVSANGSKRMKDAPSYLLDALHESGPEIVIITDGARGVYCADATQKIFMEADARVKACESTGAGDSFGSGFISGLMMGKTTDILYALDVGMTNAESVIEQVGAQAGILKRSQVASLKKRAKHKIRVIH